MDGVRAQLREGLAGALPVVIAQPTLDRPAPVTVDGPAGLGRARQMPLVDHLFE
jgi:hypothetical protein